MKKDYKLKFYTDFDGTITMNDVWINSIGKFIKDKAKFKEVEEDFVSLKITSRECIRRELEIVEDFSFEQFDKYLDDESLDPYFKKFLDWCKENDYPVKIVSEGLDYYINYILRKENIDAEVYSNKLIVSDDNKLTCEFPYRDEHCSYCGVSKRNILVNGTNDLDDEISVFIGDGVSDYCVSNYADIIFAKKRLASYCWKNNLTYFEYKDFSDVMKKIEKLKEQRKIKHRQEAKVRRKDVFMGG
ncbi:MAG: MtnX-like HAD-IB family phosphatase [Bacteroidetes bacterium]|nr:MtnX-like HAD-IB family phosphatase [Bacteroidota bacterium]MBX7046165.1 MtnX-like HAD-IB family phosphatase [Ignavibacteria bacterium]